MEIISIPRKSKRSELKEDTIAIPQDIKNISAKYSAALMPTLVISFADTRKNSSVAEKAIELKKKAEFREYKHVMCIHIKEPESPCSAIFASRSKAIPAVAILRMAVLLVRKMPLNISITPSIAERIIAFILFWSFSGYFKFILPRISADTSLVRDNNGFGNTPIRMIPTTIIARLNFTLNEISVAFDVSSFVSP